MPCPCLACGSAGCDPLRQVLLRTGTIVAAAAKLFFTFLQISERGQTDNARSIIVQLTSQEEDEESEGDKDATMKTLYLSFRCSNHKRHL